jgi:hypothetical protein
METRLCQLDYAAGLHKKCPGDTCPFWADDRCAIAPYWEDFATDSRLVEILSRLRSDLAGRDPFRVVRQFHPPGLA